MLRFHADVGGAFLAAGPASHVMLCQRGPPPSGAVASAGLPRPGRRAPDEIASGSGTRAGQASPDSLRPSRLEVTSSHSPCGTVRPARDSISRGSGSRGRRDACGRGSASVTHDRTGGG